MIRISGTAFLCRLHTWHWNITCVLQRCFLNPYEGDKSIFRSSYCWAIRVSPPPVDGSCVATPLPPTPPYFFSVARGKRLLWSPAKLRRKGKRENADERHPLTQCEKRWRINRLSNLLCRIDKIIATFVARYINILLILLQEFFLSLLHTILQNVCMIDEIVNIFIYCWAPRYQRVCDPIRLTAINQLRNAFHILSRNSRRDISCGA